MGAGGPFRPPRWINDRNGKLIVVATCIGPKSITAHRRINKRKAPAPFPAREREALPGREGKRGKSRSSCRPFNGKSVKVWEGAAVAASARHAWAKQNLFPTDCRRRHCAAVYRDVQLLMFWFPICCGDRRCHKELSLTSPFNFHYPVNIVPRVEN